MSDTYYTTIAVLLSLFVLGLLISSGVITYRQVISMAFFVVVAPTTLHLLLVTYAAIAVILEVSPGMVTLFTLLYMLFIIPVAIAIELKWYILTAIIAGVLLRTSTSGSTQKRNA